MGFSCKSSKNSSFCIQHSSLLFWREKVLNELGLRVVRFGNDEVLRDAEPSAVVGKIKALVLRQLKSSSAVP